MSLAVRFSFCLTNKLSLAPTSPLKFAMCTCVSAILFLVETTIIWYITNILYFIYDVEKNKTTIPFAVIPGILVSLTFYLIHSFL